MKSAPISDLKYKLTSRRGSVVEIGKEEHGIGNFIGHGGQGALHSISGTKLLRKKGRLKSLDELQKIQREVHFHERYYGENSIKVFYFSGGDEIKPGEIENHLKYKPSYRLVRENIQGETLDIFLNDLESPKQILFLLLQTAKMLKELHKKNIVHGDLTFSNIIVNKSLEICPIDFGESYDISAPTTKLDSVSAHIAPERKDSTPASFKQDIYSFGHSTKFRTEDGKKYWLRHDQLAKYGDWNQLIVSMLDSDPEKRPNLEKIISSLEKLYKNLPDTQPKRNGWRAVGVLSLLGGITALSLGSVVITFIAITLTLTSLGVLKCCFKNIALKPLEEKSLTSTPTIGKALGGAAGLEQGIISRKDSRPDLSTSPIAHPSSPSKRSSSSGPELESKSPKP